MKTLQDKVVSTRRKANRETIMFPNQIRADIMNNSIGAIDIVVARDPEKHEIFVNVTFFDGRIKAWKYRLYIEEFEFKVEKIDLSPGKEISGDDDFGLLYLQFQYMREQANEFEMALRFKKEKEQDEED